MTDKMPVVYLIEDMDASEDDDYRIIWTEDKSVYSDSNYRIIGEYTRSDIHEKAVKERDALKEELSRKDKAYTERMMVVRMLALKSGCVYGVAKDDNEGWDDEWRNVVYIDLPEGQVSWHIAPHDMHLFDDFPPYAGKWDGNCNGNSESFVKAVKQNALKAENERLRDALEHIANGCLVPPDGGAPTFNDLVETARKALQGGDYVR